MARTVEEINQLNVENLVIQMGAIGIVIDPTKWSRRNVLRAICYAFSIGQALMEQLQDVYMDKVTTIQSKSAAATPLWLQDAMFKFQYSSTNPQILSLINLIPSYVIVDESLRIITACSIKSNVSNQVRIKVAKNSPLEALTGPELAAAQSYANNKFTSGINYVVSSSSPDKLFIEADIWYQGNFSSVIQANVIAAINNYLLLLSKTNFDGSFKVTDIEDLVRSVTGVNDILIKNLKIRKNGDAFSTGTSLVFNQTVLIRKFNTEAGYLIQENTTGQSFLNKLNFISE